MSYRKPTIIQDAKGALAKASATQGMQKSINDQFNAYSKNLSKQFEADKKKQLAEAKEKAKITEANQTAKNKAQDKLNDLLTGAGLNDASVPSSTEAVIKQLKEVYYECSISDSDECSRKMSVIEQLPKQIAQGIEVQGSLSKTFNEMNKIAPGDPNSLDTDRVSTTNYAFGEEMANNGGRNVKCNFDPETLEIYWTLDEQVNIQGDRAVPIRGAQDPTTGKSLGGKQYRINNAELIKSQLDPNNTVPFFPINGDSAPIISIMHDGDKEQGIPGLSEGLKDNILTITEKNEDGKNIEKEIDGNTDPEAVNDILRKRVNQYSFEGTLNSSNAPNLWGGSLRKNLNEVKRIKDKNPTKPEDLNSTERKLMETWYGPNWYEEGGMEDADDPMVQYENNGSAAFGPWIGGDQSAGAKKNDIVKLQRQIMSNGLILDYEKKYLLDTPEQVETKDDGTTEVNIEQTNNTTNTTTGSTTDTTTDVEASWKDGALKTFEYEGTKGSGTGTALADRGFTAAKYNNAFDGLSDKEAEAKALELFERDAVTPVVNELGDLNGVDQGVQDALYDYKFNSGRGTQDLLLIAYGGTDKTLGDEIGTGEESHTRTKAETDQLWKKHGKDIMAKLKSGDIDPGMISMAKEESYDGRVRNLEKAAKEQVYPSWWKGIKGKKNDNWKEGSKMTKEDVKVLEDYAKEQRTAFEKSWKERSSLHGGKMEISSDLRKPTEEEFNKAFEAAMPEEIVIGPDGKKYKKN
jgi:hypothetical protein